MKIVILGASGFVGKRLVTRLLQENIRPHLFLRSKKDAIKGCDVSYGDAQTGEGLKDALKGASIVINLIGRFEPPFLEQMMGNALVIANICDALDLKSLTRLIHLSAAAAYGSYATAPKESAVLTPDTAYGLSKKFGEEIIMYAHKTRAIPYIIFRPTNVYGPGSTHGVIHSMVAATMAKKHIHITGDGKQIRDFIHVDDVVEAIMLALHSRSIPAIYNLSSGETYTIMQLAQIILNIAHAHKKKILRLPQASTYIHTLTANNALIRTKLKWKPSRSLKTGIAQYIDSV